MNSLWISYVSGIQIVAECCRLKAEVAEANAGRQQAEASAVTLQQEVSKMRLMLSSATHANVHDLPKSCDLNELSCKDPEVSAVALLCRSSEPLKQVNSDMQYLHWPAAAHHVQLAQVSIPR